MAARPPPGRTVHPSFSNLQSLPLMIPLPRPAAYPQLATPELPMLTQQQVESCTLRA